MNMYTLLKSSFEINWEKIWKTLEPFTKMFLILIIGYIVVKCIMRVIKRTFSHTHLDKSLVKFLLKTIKIVLYVIVIISALNSIGVSTTGMIAGLSATAVAVAVGLKDSMSNVAGGILLLVSPRFLTGDYIECEGDSGTVMRVDLLHTTLKTPDNKVISIPNGVLINSHIINYSQQDKRRIEIFFPVSYDADVEKAKSIIMGIVREHPLVVSEPDEPLVRVMRYSESSVDIVMRCWCATGDYWNIYYDLIENVRASLDKNSIVIPYKQVDVHIKKDI